MGETGISIVVLSLFSSSIILKASLQYMIQLGRLTLLLLSAVVVAELNNNDWISKDEFRNKLPANLEPFFEATHIRSHSQCLMLCQLKNCSSAAYSKIARFCKLYQHDNLNSPLPSLKDDYRYKHQMYYKRRWCPVGWEMDRTAEKCYKIGSSSVPRYDAWDMCEKNLMSELVTFSSAKQRQNLYEILDEKYSSTSKFWTGYYLFDGKMWPRPVEKYPGYIKRRGYCEYDDIACEPLSEGQCIDKCSKAYRDQCVAVQYQKTTGTCCFKSNSCPFPNSKYTTDEYFIFEKKAPMRPWAVSKDKDCSSYTYNTVYDVSEDQCKKRCETENRCVSAQYLPPSQQCYLKERSCTQTSACTNCQHMFFNDINQDGPCPYGVRYRDVCLTYNRESRTFTEAITRCKQMGGKLLSPTEWYRKGDMFWTIRDTFGGDMWLDFTTSGHYPNWTSHDTVFTYLEPEYQMWSWYSGEPNSGSSYDCAYGSGSIHDNTGNRYQLADRPCSNTQHFICETPISQSWPESCRFTPVGSEFAGVKSYTASGAVCKDWTSSSYSNWKLFPDYHNSHSFCRNPDPSNGAIPVAQNGPWCYRHSDDTPENCESIPMCRKFNIKKKRKSFN